APPLAADPKRDAPGRLYAARAAGHDAGRRKADLRRPLFRDGRGPNGCRGSQPRDLSRGAAALSLRQSAWRHPQHPRQGDRRAAGNMPACLASYRLVYRTRESIRAHPWAAIYVPTLLLIACISAVVASRWTDVPVSALLTVSSTYLAWHYTSQAWGMVATFTYLDGNPFNAVERRLVRSSLYILAAWHVVWFFYLGSDRYVDLRPLYVGLSVLSEVGLAMGL